MLRKGVWLALGAVALTVAVSTSGNEKEEIYRWTASGTFPAHGTYDWCGNASSSTVWEYEIDILEVDWAVVPHGYASSGKIVIQAAGIGPIEARVDAVKHDIRGPALNPWPTPNLAAVGTARYDAEKRLFMFLWAQDAMWLAVASDTVSHAHVENWWEQDRVFPKGDVRGCQLHSLNPGASIEYPSPQKVCKLK